MNYYDSIAGGYDELHKEEQFAKLSLIKEQGIVQTKDTLLDVGCGTGFSLDYFDVYKATGIEPCVGLLSQYKGTKKILQGRAEDLPFADKSYDVVISVTAIQNFADVRKGLEEIQRVGKDRFVLTVLKKSPQIAQIEATLRSVFADFIIKRVEEDKDYLFFITA